MVEAVGQLIHFFRNGLDYAFIPSIGMRGVLSIYSWILVPAHQLRISGSMSLYRAGLRLALFLPLGVAMPSEPFTQMPTGFTDVSPVFTLLLRAKATFS